MKTTSIRSRFRNDESAVPRWWKGTLAALLVTVTGCAVGPNHKTPEVATPDTFRGEKEAAPESFADLPWWEVYSDPTLFRLIKTATESAYDLRIALARVEVARQSYRGAVWSLAPTIGATGGVGDSIGSLSVPSIYPPQDANGNWGIGAGVSWEPDVWGRLRRITQVARFELLAADEDRRGVYVALVGDVAELYFQLTSIDKQRVYANRAVATRRETLSLFEQRSGGGVGSDLEVARARANVKSAESSVLRLELLRAQAENALSFLLARPPGPIQSRTSIDRLDEPPQVPAGLPSTLLERRPDIRSAERRLRAANARIGVEMADFFPKFELTAFLGVASPDLKSAQMVRGGVGLFSWTLPFLGGERERAEYDAARATWEGVAAQYERTVVQAFREVADALAAVNTLRDRLAALEGQTEALEEAERIAVDRYRGGVANYLDVLTVQEQVLVAQLEMADIQGRRLAAVARLYRTLGGGWPLPDEDDDGKSNKGDAPAKESKGESAKK